MDVLPDRVPPSSTVSGEAVQAMLGECDESIKNYCCYLMLDFATVDPALDEVPLACVLNLSEKLGIRERLEELANRELRVSKKTQARLRQESAEMLAKAGRRPLAWTTVEAYRLRKSGTRAGSSSCPVERSPATIG